MIEFIVTSMAISSITWTISKTYIARPIQRWAERQVGWIKHLASCVYCQSNWVAMPLVFAVPAEWLTLPIVIEQIVLWQGLVTLSTIFTGVMQRLFGWDEMQIEHLNDIIDRLEEQQNKE